MIFKFLKCVCRFYTSNIDEFCSKLTVLTAGFRTVSHSIPSPLLLHFNRRCSMSLKCTFNRVTYNEKKHILVYRGLFRVVLICTLGNNGLMIAWQFLALTQFWGCCIKGALCSFGGEVVITSKLMIKDNSIFTLFLLSLCNLYLIFCQYNLKNWFLFFCSVHVTSVACPGTGIPPSRGFFHLFLFLSVLFSFFFLSMTSFSSLGSRV